MKKILFVLLVIILTGCSADYVIIMDEKGIKEELDVFMSVEEYNSIDSEDLSSNIFDFERGYEFYNKDEFKESLDKLGYKYTYNNSYEFFATESHASKCYENINITTDKTIKVESSSYFMCYDMHDNLDEVTLVVKTKNKVLDHNADKVKGITYTWNINKNNYMDKPIMIEISKERVSSNMLLFYVASGIVLFVLLVLLIFNKIKKSNSF